MKKLVVWGLFDDANRCYYQSLKDSYEVYSIGINKKNEKNYHQINLSILNNDLFNQLNKLPKPDIILASPPCNSWSKADTNTIFLDSINIENDKASFRFKTFNFYEKHNKKSHKNKRRDPVSKVKLFLNGFSTALSTIEIIKHYKPKYFAIENPYHSNIWKVLEFFNFSNKYTINKTMYSNYDSEFTDKPTCFLSNISLNLKWEKPKRSGKNLNTFSRKDRSNIPKELISEILTRFIEDMRNKKEQN
ncbi:hypothetical protein C4M97_00435 [Mycoplasmopsis pullorum]|uniref:DNA cytosine methyltransferase n=1 Tax=Mycoplasmopsis pullorum TaxID=48003 RepID=UPI00111BC8A1|nr:DNA cytosine methyltransferase [Mycoplasmopsis pullorum]TNK82144.1 hypothetical protein C4M94_01925 [Mycoplasmopsis pullorum]TNK82453.1 hypothetical protein C4M80_03005 [Mycoplasmopsis pullorum]TNK83585.1 hypothetical protein C4M81_03840 [Mycoplasmopsis pullorum]TNK84584.1 hypothetical protein C4M92_03165 [Mycoplasmopsis pullorum]TNK86149.1 hypothetical protein C4M85_00985 [Mycoplasmopsis pullorum]